MLAKKEYWFLNGFFLDMGCRGKGEELAYELGIDYFSYFC